jgi:hypothetical protein
MGLGNFDQLDSIHLRLRLNAIRVLINPETISKVELIFKLYLINKKSFILHISPQSRTLFVICLIKQ